MTYEDYKLRKAILALFEARGCYRDWLKGGELYHFARLPEIKVPQGVRNQYSEFQIEILNLQKKYQASSLIVPADKLADGEVMHLVALFERICTAWSGNQLPH
jgi:hypothetical protein